MNINEEGKPLKNIIFFANGSKMTAYRRMLVCFFLMIAGFLNRAFIVLEGL